MNCREVEPLLMLHACGELEGAEGAAVEEHLAACESCRAALDAERKLVALVAAGQPAEPDAFQLTICRNELTDALDLADEKKSPVRRWLGALRPRNWMALHPAWGAAMFLVVGIVVGNVGPRLFTTQPDIPLAGRTDGNDIIRAGSPASLQPMQITGLEVMPGEISGMPQVTLRYRPDETLKVQGTPNDASVRQALTFVVENGQRFDSGKRLDAIDLLRSQSEDEQVRKALCHAARQDSNPGVRLKAVEALREAGHDEAVRQILIDALLHDDNPGVRVEAINALRAFAETAGPERGTEFPRLVEVLRDRMQSDPNTYVRLQSAAAVRQLSRASY